MYYRTARTQTDTANAIIKTVLRLKVNAISKKVTTAGAIARKTIQIIGIKCFHDSTEHCVQVWSLYFLKDIDTLEKV